jgi:hypothetical protein
MPKYTTTLSRTMQLSLMPLSHPSVVMKLLVLNLFPQRVHSVPDTTDRTLKPGQGDSFDRFGRMGGPPK